MPTPFPLEIVTLQGPVFEGDVERASLVGGDGGLSIEARHAPLVTNVVPCPVVLRNAAGEGDLQMAVGTGFLLVSAGGASLLVDSAERVGEIDSARAQAAKDRAEHWMASTEPDADVGRAKRALARALARLHVAKER